MKKNKKNEAEEFCCVPLNQKSGIKAIIPEKCQVGDMMVATAMMMELCIQGMAEATGESYDECMDELISSLNDTHEKFSHEDYKEA